MKVIFLYSRFFLFLGEGLGHTSVVVFVTVLNCQQASDASEGFWTPHTFELHCTVLRISLKHILFQCSDQHLPTC